MNRVIVPNMWTGVKHSVATFLDATLSAQYYSIIGIAVGGIIGATLGELDAKLRGADTDSQQEWKHIEKEALLYAVSFGFLGYSAGFLSMYNKNTPLPFLLFPLFSWNVLPVANLTWWLVRSPAPKQ